MHIAAATLIDFDAGTWTATVRYRRSLAATVPGVPVSRDIDSGDMTAGRRLAVAVFGDAPADAMIVGIH